MTEQILEAWRINNRINLRLIDHISDEHAAQTCSVGLRDCCAGLCCALEARRRNIRTTGTLGVLDDAAARGLVDLRSAIERLRGTNFRAADSLLEWLISPRSAKDQRQIRLFSRLQSSAPS